jgi:Fic family protein
VDLSWASSKLEGNTYSRLDTQKLIELGQIAKGKDAIETRMILNYKSAIEILIESADEVGFDAFTFQNLDQAAFTLLLTDALRQLHEGGIARYRLRRSEYSACSAGLLARERG